MLQRIGFHLHASRVLISQTAWRIRTHAHNNSIQSSCTEEKHCAPALAPQTTCTSTYRPWLPAFVSAVVAEVRDEAAVGAFATTATEAPLPLGAFSLATATTRTRLAARGDVRSLPWCESPAPVAGAAGDAPTAAVDGCPAPVSPPSAAENDGLRFWGVVRGANRRLARRVPVRAEPGVWLRRATGRRRLTDPVGGAPLSAPSPAPAPAPAPAPDTPTLPRLRPTTPAPAPATPRTLARLRRGECSATGASGRERRDMAARVPAKRGKCGTSRRCPLQEKAAKLGTAPPPATNRGVSTVSTGCTCGSRTNCSGKRVPGKPFFKRCRSIIIESSPQIGVVADTDVAAWQTSHDEIGRLGVHASTFCAVLPRQPTL